jgi:hypothetical protein
MLYGFLAGVFLTAFIALLLGVLNEKKNHRNLYQPRLPRKFYR